MVLDRFCYHRKEPAAITVDMPVTSIEWTIWDAVFDDAADSNVVSSFRIHPVKSVSSEGQVTRLKSSLFVPMEIRKPFPYPHENFRRAIY